MEERRTSKRHLEFIKSSQQYYRAYIQELALRFGGIPELEAIALKVSAEGQGHPYKFEHLLTCRADIDRPKQAKEVAKLRPIVLESCFETLMQLGDLSRWREQKRLPGEVNWGPAIGFYDLAYALRPSSGKPQHQLAVLAASSNSGNLRILYHFYLSLGAVHPHPRASSNLNQEFKKIVAANEKAKLSKNVKEEDTNQQLIEIGNSFVNFHAEVSTFDSNDDFRAAAGKATRLLYHSLQESAVAPILQKIVLINLCAEHVAAERAKGNWIVPITHIC